VSCHTTVEQAFAAALPGELAAHAGELATLIGLAPDAIAARLAERPVLVAALVGLVGRPLEVAGQPLQVVTGYVGTLQQITISGGYVDRIVGTAINFQIPPAPRVIDPAAAQELLAALPRETLAPVAPLPELHRMPFARNPHFVGRDADLLFLACALKGEGAGAAIGSAAATTGLGGVGKTNLATEFAHRYGQFFAGGVFWLSFADPASVSLEIAACGVALDLPGFADLKLEDQAARVRAAWAQAVPRLLIFDNCDETEPGRAEALIQQWRPTTGGCRVLITSRRGVWSTNLGLATLPLGVLRPEESLALLRKHRPDLAADDPALAAIAAELGDLPLALYLAGSYLETYRDSAEFGDPAALLAELCDTRLLGHEALQGVDSTPSPTNHELHVARTFALSYERLVADDPTDAQALRLLARTAYLAPGAIVQRNLALATLELAAEDRAGRRQAERGLRELLGLGLIEREGEDGLRMHRLVGAYVRQVSDDAAAQGAVEQAVIAVAGGLVDAPTLTPIAAFLPVLRGVTDAALPREDADAAMLCISLGRHLDRMGAYATAQPYLERALAMSERVLGSDHPQTATSLNNLAALFRAQGSYDAARPLLERALAISERVLGSDHPQTATSLNNLAGLHYDQGSYDAARPLLERALAMSERVLGPDHPQTATSLNNLAALHHAQGSYDAARPLYARALALRERVLGPDHPDTATSLNNLAALHHAQGSYDAARPLFARALAMSERVLGPDHPQTAGSLNNLAGLLKDQGSYDAARPLYERALAISERVLGPDHPQTAASLNNLAGLLKDQGSYDAARPLYERALAISERVLGPDHPDTATSLNNLAALFRAQGNYEAARPLYDRALDISERVLGPEHPDTATSLNNLAVNAYYQGDLPAAERLMIQALRIRTARLGPDHPDTQGSRQSLDAIQQRLASASPQPPSDPTEALAPLLAAIAAIADGNEEQRPAVEQSLAQLEDQGWMLRGPVARICQGERDRDALVEGLDVQETLLVERILELIHRTK